MTWVLITGSRGDVDCRQSEKESHEEVELSETKSDFLILVLSPAQKSVEATSTTQSCAAVFGGEKFSARLEFLSFPSVFCVQIVREPWLALLSDDT